VLKRGNKVAKNFKKDGKKGLTGPALLEMGGKPFYQYLWDARKSLEKKEVTVPRSLFFA
jgi:hypothetical protein